MLSEEEKKAIKYFYNLRSTIDESYMLFDEEINVKCGKETIKQISLVLNLITKLQKENELAKEQLKKQCEIADERNDLLVKVQELQKENKEKDEIIDSIVKAMDKIQDPQVCKYCDNIKLNHGYCTDAGKCKEGIKQYFERKVKNVKNKR